MLKRYFPLDFWLMNEFRPDKLLKWCVLLSFLVFMLPAGAQDSQSSDPPVETDSLTVEEADQNTEESDQRLSGESDTVRFLSLQECIFLALQNNLDIQIERINPQIAMLDLQGSYSYYDPNLSLSQFSGESLSPTYFDPEGRLILGRSQDFSALSSGLAGRLITGLRYNVDTSMNFRRVNDFNTPADYSASAGFSLTQPLLRNFWIDPGRLQIKLSKENLKMTKQALRLQLINIITSVETAYYDLIFAIENVQVQEKALQLAKRLVEENRTRVKVGVMAPLDETQAESQAAGSEADLFSTQRLAIFQENALKNLITDDFESWQKIKIVTSDPLVAIEENLDLQASWSAGLVMRPDLAQLRIDLERRDIDLVFRKNQLLPSLDLGGSFRYNGVGSTETETYDNMRNGDRWTISTVLSFPLGNRAARNNLRSTRLAKKQAILVLKRAEQNVLVQIDNDIKLVQTNLKRVSATKRAKEFSEEALDAEEKKLENGKSTSFEVLRLQRDLTSAASGYIRALADYNISVTRLYQSEGSTLEKRNVELIERAKRTLMPELEALDHRSDERDSE